MRFWSAISWIALSLRAAFGELGLLRGIQMCWSVDVFDRRDNTPQFLGAGARAAAGAGVHAALIVREAPVDRRVLMLISTDTCGVARIVGVTAVAASAALPSILDVVASTVILADVAAANLPAAEYLFFAGFPNSPAYLFDIPAGSELVVFDTTANSAAQFGIRFMEMPSQ